MIRKNTIEAVYPLADLLAEKGILLTPIETTPVDQLVRAGHLEILTGEHKDIDITDRLINGSMSKDARGVVTHDLVMEELARVLTKTIQGNFHVAKNVVNPIVKEVAEDARLYLESSLNVKKTHVEVKPEFYEEIWNSPEVFDMVKRFAEQDFKEVPLTVQYPNETDRETLFKLAATGSTTLDGYLQQLCNGMTDEQIADLYVKTFGDNYNRVPSLAAVLNQFPRNGALIIHMWARKLYLNAPEGTGMSLSVYKDYMSTLLAVTGRTVLSTISRRESDIKLKRLLTSYPLNKDAVGKSNVVIKVNGDVYNKWLEDGGSPETIIGAFLTDGEKGYTKLLEEKDSYAKHWERTLRILNNTERFNKFNFAFEGIERAVAKQIVDLDPEVLSVDKSLLQGKLQENMQMLPRNFHEDLFKWSRILVCRTLFPHTNALELLSAIDENAKVYPDLPVRELAMLATIDVVGDWLSKLFKVTK
ncbi:MAG: hypothetical protein IBX57_01120 [Gammaproteobacteria bacterium]|nr:hypothetical protein [Gammaproteobacteria bacterium]